MATAKSETLKATEINAATGEVIVRDLTAEELAQRELDATESAAQQSIADAKVAARASALAKLADLGLTAEEIAAL
jgi:acyl-CoA reductase-like NAD-dependent aldehyde dehydrogenase